MILDEVHNSARVIRETISDYIQLDDEIYWYFPLKSSITCRANIAR